MAKRTEHPNFASWSGMIQRCSDPKCYGYPYYGARGVKVCYRWRNFWNFVRDMGMKPEGATLERIDTNGDYTPENCKWATWTEQQNNKRNNRRLTHDGRTQTIAQWARELGLKQGMIVDRLRLGWSTEKTLATPPIRNATGFQLSVKPRYLTHAGETLRQAEWCRRTGLSPQIIAYRLAHGWTVEKTLATPAPRRRESARARVAG